MPEIWDVYDRDRNKTGKTCVRGEPRPNDEYHLVVQVWIKNSRGEWLISKRTPNKPYPLLWEPTGGSAIAGDASLSAALREVREELGISLDPARGRIFRTYRRDAPECSNPSFLDVWVFEHDCPIEDIVLQEGETCDAMWATGEHVRGLVASGEFIPIRHDPYIDELLEEEGRG